MKSSAVILCVDDEEIPRTLRKLVLENHGYRVTAAASGKEALEALASHKFDLVLTDQMMPGMTGTDLAKQIKSGAGIPVVIISGVNELPADVSCADRFISKTEGPVALLRGIAETLELYGED